MSATISQEAKKELMEKLDDIKDNPSSNESSQFHVSDWDHAINRAISIVESFPTSSDGLGDSTSEPENRWIPVTDWQNEEKE